MLAAACGSGPVPPPPVDQAADPPDRPPVEAGAADLEPPRSGGLDLQPYLVHKTAVMARLAWRTDAERGSVVRYGRSFSFESGEVRTRRGLMHVADLTGLQADTLYHYEVDGAARGTFRTQIEGVERIFLVVSHTHGSEGIDHYPDELLVSTMAKLRPDFVVHSGDITFYSRYLDFRRYYFRLFEDLLAETPIYVAPGNHDSGFPFVESIGLRAFKELLPYPYAGGEADACYAIEQGNMRFLVLSYLSPLGPGSSQRRWLGERLAEKQWDFQAVVFGGSHDVFYDRESLLDFLVQNGADLAFCGDGTQPEEFAGEHDGLPLFFVGSRHSQPHPFLRCKLSEGNLTVRQLFADGKVGGTRHLFTRRRHDPVVTAPVRRVVGESHVVGYEAVLAEPLDSARVRGIQLDVEVAPGKVTALGVIVVPADRVIDDPAGGYPTEQMPRLREGRHFVTLGLPNRTVDTGRPFPIRSIKLVFLSVGPDDLVVEKVHLY